MPECFLVSDTYRVYKHTRHTHTHTSSLSSSRRCLTDLFPGHLSKPSPLKIISFFLWKDLPQLRGGAQKAHQCTLQDHFYRVRLHHGDVNHYIILILQILNGRLCGLMCPGNTHPPTHTHTHTHTFLSVDILLACPSPHRGWREPMCRLTCGNSALHEQCLSLKKKKKSSDACILF